MESKLQTENNAGQPDIRGQLPLLLIALSLVIWFSFQLYQTVKMRENLSQTLKAQEPQLQNANKIRDSLSALVTGLKRLAEQGNSNAAKVVEALAQRGIKIADQKPAPPENPPKPQP